MSNTPSPVDAALQHAAEEALATYGLQGAELTFVRHNENLVFRVQCAGDPGRYLLRVHSPRSEAFRGLSQDVRAIEAELQWLVALRRDTDIGVQQPQANLGREYVTTVTHHVSGEPIPCSLLTWVEGEPFKQDVPEAPTLAHRFGQLARRLHEHTRNWPVSLSLYRPFYDAARLRRALAQLGEGVSLGLITDFDYQAICRDCACIFPLFETLPQTRDNWGLIHADLPGNLLVRSGDLVPIDFSLSGFGYYQLDIAICMCNLKHSLRQPFVDGYALELTDQVRWQLEAFTMVIILITAGGQVRNSDWESWYARRFPRMAREYGPKLARHEAFLFDI